MCTITHSHTCKYGKACSIVVYRTHSHSASLQLHSLDPASQISVQSKEKKASCGEILTRRGGLRAIIFLCSRSKKYSISVSSGRMPDCAPFIHASRWAVQAEGTASEAAALEKLRCLPTPHGFTHHVSIGRGASLDLSQMLHVTPLAGWVPASNPDELPDKEPGA